jgi:hypothetical protein
MQTDYDKGYSYLCSIGNYIETKENLLKKLKQGGVSTPEMVFTRLLENGEIVPAKKEGSYVLKFKKCRGGGEEEDMMSE